MCVWGRENLGAEGGGEGSCGETQYCQKIKRNKRHKKEINTVSKEA